MAADGLSVQTLAEQLQPPHYQLRWADLSNGAFVTELSREVLGEPLIGDLHTYWTARIGNGITMTRADAFILAVGLPEFQNGLFGNTGVEISV